ncbi:MAG TPA: hypothetical protein VIZ18_19100 [Ktedonobacteraceae bacterium]
MFPLPLLHRLQARTPLTEKHIHRILRTAGFTASYRFEAVFAVDDSSQHYYLCHQAQLDNMTLQQFNAALRLALSFHLPEPGQSEDTFESLFWNARRCCMAKRARSKKFFEQV